MGEIRNPKETDKTETIRFAVSAIAGPRTWFRNLDFLSGRASSFGFRISDLRWRLRQRLRCL